MDWIIPPQPPSDKLQAAKLYQDQFGWTVHPLAPPGDKNVAPKSRGKMPIIEAWPRLALDAVTDEFMHQYWGNGLCQNIGVVVRPPHVVVDLDSKSDAGDHRGPFWIFTANRERLGKDYMAGIPGLLFDGHTNEDAPLEPHNSTETRKRITSALMAGRGRMHFANCAGHIQDSALEQAITSNVWADRVLGSNTDISLPNEIEFSMSGNMGVITYRGDLAHRARHIRLTYAHENPNQRQFKNPLLHQWVFDHRSDILSALVALIKHWFTTGQPTGTTPFASFPKWASVVGGIMLANGLGDPCLPEEMSTVGGNEEERDMKTLFNLAHAKFGSVGVELKKVIALVKSDEAGSQLFGWLNLAERGGETAFGKMLRRYSGRIFEGIILKVHDQQKRPKFVFEKFDSAQKSVSNPVDGVFGPAKHGSGGDSGEIGDVLYSTRGGNVNGEEKKDVGDVNKSCEDSIRNVPVLPGVPTYNLITDAAALPDIALAIATSGTPVALDIETYGEDALNPFHGDIRLLSLGTGPGTPWLLDLKAVGYDLGPLKPVLESVLLVGHNIKFDLRWLGHKCGLQAQRVFCAMTASRLLSAGRKDLKHDLTAVVDRYLERTLPQDCSRSDWGAAQLTTEQYQYAASDVIHLHRLKTVLDRELADAGLIETASLEMSLIRIVAGMETTGLPVDTAKLRKLQEDYKNQEATARATLLKEFGAAELNPNSVPQVKDAFQKLGVDVDSTSAETLVAVDHPAAKALLDFRGFTKQLELTQKLLDAVEADGRIHGSFNPTGTATGRFSSSKPNLQNISRGPVRSCLVATPGCKLVVADYSQIELRAVAAIAGETRMLEAYRNREDLHRKTASIILDKTPEAVTSNDRQLAKPVNFGLIYGQRAMGLVRYAKTTYGVTFSLEQAETFRERFFSEYEGLARWHQDAWELANGDAIETRTRLGRRRWLPERSRSWQRFTQLVNTPVQGGCADGLKLALVELADKLPANSRIISTVHDEIIIETPESDAANVKELVCATMIGKMAGIFPEAPIEVEAKICASWGEK
jgi:DNA polymerase-1